MKNGNIESSKLVFRDKDSIMKIRRTDLACVYPTAFEDIMDRIANCQMRGNNWRINELTKLSH